MSILPPEVPAHFEQRGLQIPDASHGELGWTQGDAVALIDNLDGTKVAVVGGEVFRVNEWSQVRIDDWQCERELGESATDFAERSRRVARKYVGRHAPDALGNPIYVLWLDPQRAAA